MAQNFTNLEELFAYIEKQLPLNLEIIGEEVRQILRDNVQQLWYDRPYTSTHYTRTLEYINSLTIDKAKKVGNQYEVQIYFATDLILPHPGENSEWGQHESVYGEDVSASIPYYIEYGNNSSLFKYEGVHPVETTKQWLEESDYIKQRMIELLKYKGFNISIR